MASALHKFGHRRSSQRYEFEAIVEVSRNGRRESFGKLFDISRDGVGFDADPPLMVGQTYLLTIKDLASVSCRVVHNSGYSRHGAVLLISQARKLELENKIRGILKSGRHPTIL